MTFVSVMEPADLRDCYDGITFVRHLHGTGLWAVHVKRQVGSRAVVVFHVLLENPSQMVFAEDDDVVQTIAPYAAV